MQGLGFGNIRLEVSLENLTVADYTALASGMSGLSTSAVCQESVPRTYSRHFSVQSCEVGL